MDSKSSGRNSVVIGSTKLAACKVCKELVEEIKRSGFGDQDIFAIHLALEEGLVNAVKHGNGFDPDKSVQIKWEITDSKFDITIADEGEGFEPSALPDPRSDENLEKTGGRGVLLMRSYMDVVEFNDKGNRIHMVRYRGGQDGAAKPTPGD
ncbi:MAG: ATP-binding protein [Anaerohalosphaera sp.]|nr:ATP-binding protein [Anaerohalosphaera sp.]